MSLDDFSGILCGCTSKPCGDPPLLRVTVVRRSEAIVEVTVVEEAMGAGDVFWVGSSATRSTGPGDGYLNAPMRPFSNNERPHSAAWSSVSTSSKVPLSQSQNCSPVKASSWIATGQVVSPRLTWTRELITPNAVGHSQCHHLSRMISPFFSLHIISASS
jgi:hypothetical protein